MTGFRIRATVSERTIGAINVFLLSNHVLEDVKVYFTIMFADIQSFPRRSLLLEYVVSRSCFLTRVSWMLRGSVFL